MKGIRVLIVLLLCLWGTVRYTAVDLLNAGEVRHGYTGIHLVLSLLRLIRNGLVLLDRRQVPRTGGLMEMLIL